MHAVDPQILGLIDELDDLRKTRDDAWQVPRAEGEVLFQIALATNARLIVEVGTSYGFSGLFWAAALKRLGGAGRSLHTLDLSEKKYHSAGETFRRAGVEGIVHRHLGDAAALLPAMPGSIDIVFLDAGNKKLARSYFDLIWPKVRPGGCALTDNATTHRDLLADFVRSVRSQPDASSTELPVGNGLEWTVKLA